MHGHRVFHTFEVTEESHTLEAYKKRGGYEALEKVLKGMQPADVQAEVAASGIRGRGGAGFPTATKWSFLAKNAPVYYLVCNADEGEPGTFKDRWIFEHTSHNLIEGMVLASYAINCRTAFIYIRGEFDLSYKRLMQALKEAYEAGFVGENILGSGFSCDIIVQQGGGAYVCGEESSLLSSIEGKKGYPKNKPPFPAVKGLFQAPTCVNNVETLSALPWILRNGGAKYAEYGTEKNKGTRLFGISGHVNRPGLYEREVGYPYKKMIYEDCGGILGGKELKAVIPGGNSTPILKPEQIENLTMDIEAVAAQGSMLGSGGVIVIAEGTCIPTLLQVMTRFYAHESCGQCTPCREGTTWMNQIVTRIAKGEGKAGDIENLERIAKGIMGNTVCALGAAAAMPVMSYLKQFRHEFEYFIEHGRSMCDGRLEI
jgi:NADH-quinone oxidoreductase subunit F